MKQQNKEPICGNCRLYNHTAKQCNVAVLIEGKTYFMPVSFNDHCHMDELGIPVEQVRWWQEEDQVKIEYPEGFFGK